MEKKFSNPNNSITLWDNLFTQYNIKGKDDLTFLEIGCFEGNTTCWLLDNILTGKNCKIHVVDTFSGTRVEYKELYDIFKYNTSEYGEKVVIHEGKSQIILKKEFENNKFDFIFIDGSHKAPDVLQDAILSHSLLKINGILIFDDVFWKNSYLPEDTESPGLGIRAFYQNFAKSYQILFDSYQMWLYKISE